MCRYSASIFVLKSTKHTMALIKLPMLVALGVVILVALSNTLVQNKITVFRWIAMNRCTDINGGLFFSCTLKLTLVVLDKMQ